MSGGRWAPFGDDHRRGEGPTTLVNTGGSSTATATASRQSLERPPVTQAPQEHRAEVNGPGAPVPVVERRGPGGAGGGTGVTMGATGEPPSATKPGHSGGSPPRLHADPSAGLASKTAVPLASTGHVTLTGHSSGAEPLNHGAATANLQSSSFTAPATTAGASSDPAAPPAGIADKSTNGPSTAAPHTTAAGGKDDDDSALRRPAKALSANLVALLKVINAQYCTKQRMEAPGTKYNNGFDDREGHYLVMLGEEILGRYTVQEVLGKGSFGTVVRCYDEKRRETVALKITRRGSNFRTQAKLELDLLLKLNSNPALNNLVVKLLKVFDWQGHLVLAFELLSFNLYQLIKCTRYTGVSLDLVRKFAYQLMHTLRHLEEQEPAPIIHCDIKPENILLRNQSRSGIRLIDFGSACYANKRVHRYIQSRFYRSPEVILYLDYTTAIDRWSVGCVLVELFTGTPLFDGRTEAAQLARFEATLGPLPDDMLNQSRKTSKFYTGNATTGYSLIEHPAPHRSLESVLSAKQIPGDQAQAQQTRAEFLDFIKRLLRYRPDERIKCRDAFQHPFLMPLYATDTAQHVQAGATTTSGETHRA